MAASSRETHTRKRSSSSSSTLPRFWYGGKAMLEPTALDCLEAADPKPVLAYDQQNGRQIGRLEGLMTKLRSKLLALQPQAAMRPAPNPDKRLEQFLRALAHFCETPKDRLEILKHTGIFHFRRGESVEARKARIVAAVADPDEATDPDACRHQVRRLTELWSPRHDSLLDAIINRPVEAGRTLAKRLDAGHPGRLAIVTTSVDKADHSVQYPLIETRTVAYEREGVIHLVAGLQEFLEEWEAGKHDEEEDTRSKGAFSVFETLILHELVEVVVEEASDLDPLSAHVIASTFERSLRGAALSLAAEDYCTQWESALQPAETAIEVKELEIDFDVDGDDDEADDIPTWTDYLITHDELRPEAFETRTDAEQRAILREMFGEEVAIEEDLAA